MWGPRADEVMVNSSGGSLKLGLGGGGGLWRGLVWKGERDHGLMDFGGEPLPRGDLQELMA